MGDETTKRVIWAAGNASGFRGVVAALAVLALGCGVDEPGSASESSKSSAFSLATPWADRRPDLLVYGPGKLAAFAAPDGTDLLSRLRVNESWAPAPSGDWDMRAMVTTGGVESLSWAAGTIHLFAVQADGSLIFEALDPAYNPPWVLDQQWPRWAPVGMPTGQKIVGQPAVVSWDQGRIDVFVRAEDSNVYIRSWLNGQGWVPADGSSPLWNPMGGPVASSPSALSWGPNLLHIAAVGVGGDVLLKAWNAGTWVPSQTGWVSLGKAGSAGTTKFVGRPIMTSWANGRLDLFVRAEDNNLYIRSYVAGEWVPATGWASLGPCVGDPAVTIWGPERLHILARQSNGTVGLKAYNGSWVPSQTGWVSLGAPGPGVVGNPEMAAPLSSGGATDELNIAVYGADHAVYFKRWITDHWIPSETTWERLTGPTDNALDATPFWSDSTMRKESVLMTDKEDGNGPRARLLVPGTSVVKVEDMRGTFTLTSGVDWSYDAAANQLRLLGSAGPRLKASELVTGGIPEGHYWHDKQLAVTYTRSASLPVGNTATGRSTLASTRTKLSQGGTVRIVLYGDSIAAGLNASGVTGAPPYRPSWGQQLANQLISAYGANVVLENPSLPGAASDWGAANVQNLVVGHHPDLVVVAFGMNDGGALSPCQFETNVIAMVDAIRQGTTAGIILVAPMLPNKVLGGTAALTTRLRFREVLKRVAQSKQTGFVDITSVHQALLGWTVPSASCVTQGTCTCSSAVTTGTETLTGPKTYQDQSGNNINHPNDWLNRWYAQEVGTLLSP